MLALFSVTALAAACTGSSGPGEGKDEPVGHAEEADNLTTAPAGSSCYDPMCTSAGDHTVENPNWPYHEAGMCGADEYTFADAASACGGGKVKYFSYYCGDLPDGTHTWTTYFGCCAAPTCGAGLTACCGACADVTSDTSNCGACGNVCGGACVNGACASDGSGSSAANAGASCQAIVQAHPSSADGLYWIAPGGTPAYQAYCDMTTSGGGWTLVAYGENANLSGSLTTANGTYAPLIRTGSANVNAQLLVTSATTAAMSWHDSAFPTGNLSSYETAVSFPIPSPASINLDPIAGGYSCYSSYWTQVDVTCLVGNCGPEVFPPPMYTRTASLGATYGDAYGLVHNVGNPQCDWYMDGQPFTAIYLGIDTDVTHSGVAPFPGSIYNRDGTQTMAFWLR